MISALPATIQNLSVTEKIQLIEDIWDSIATEPDELTLTKAQKRELDKRIENLKRNPDQGSTWEDSKKRIISGK